MMNKLIAAILILGIAYIFSVFYSEFESKNDLNPIASHYVANGPDEIGAANIVTSIIVTYRGLDTLGEVTILFITAAIIGFFLNYNRELSKREVRMSSELLMTGAKILVPVVFLFGFYVFVNGHLTPGGGFQGGAIVASGTLLMILANPVQKINHRLITWVESLSGFMFVLLGILGIAFAGGFLDNRFLPLGNFGHILSAGAIPLIYSFIGLKVGSELSNILVEFKGSSSDIIQK